MSGRTIYGENIVEFREQSKKTQRKKATIVYLVDQNKDRDTNRYQITEDQNQREPDQVSAFINQGLQTIRFIIPNTLLPLYQKGNPMQIGWVKNYLQILL